MVLPIYTGPGDVLFLLRLVSAKQQKNHGLFVQAVVHAVARTVIYFQFVDAFPYGTILTKVAEPNPVEPDTDLLAGHDILETVKTHLERFFTRLGQIIGYRVLESFHGKQCSI